MIKNNLYRWEPTNLQIDEIILAAYTNHSNRCFAYINSLDCPPQYIADMLTDLDESIMNSNPKFKGITSNL